MRNLLLAIPVALLLLPSHGAAQSRDYPLTTRSGVTAVQVKAPQRAYHVTRDQTDAVKGNYVMSNGWFLNVKATSHDIVAQIDNEAPMHLMAIAPDRFVTADGNVSMQFNQDDSGDDLVMSYVPTSNIAAVITIGSTMAAR